MMINVNEVLSSLNAVLPMVVLAGWGCILVLLDLFIPAGRKGITAGLAALGLGVALLVNLLQTGQETSAFGGMITVDGFSTFLNAFFLVSGLLGIGLSFQYLKRVGIERGEFYTLLLFTVVGMMLMGASNDLIMIFLSLEMLSIPLYVMAGFAVPRQDSEEASIKYFLLGAFSTGIFVYGTALVFGATGTTSLTGVIAAIHAGSAQMVLLLSGAGLLLIALGFKVAAVPFHMWTPDVYQGAPTAVTAFMSVGVKAVGFAALLRIFILAFPVLSVDLVPVLWALSALTMVVGNIVAIAQRNIKRLLAYSSIAHAGYILMALVPYKEFSAETVASALVYLVAYGITSFTAWAVVIALEHAEGHGLELDDYAGLSRKEPLLAAAMAVAMISFTGIPPTLGFIGKFYIFRTALEGGFISLAIIGVLTSLVSAYYYLRVVVLMYMHEGEPKVAIDPWLYGVAVVTATATIILSIFSGPLLSWAEQALLLIL